MKKIFNTMKFPFCAALIIAAAMVPTSCIEELESQVEGKGTNRFRPAVEDGHALAVFDTKPGSYPLVDIWRDVKSAGDLNSGATLEFEVDNSIITRYNASNPATETDYTIVPSNAVSVVGNSVTFEAGEFTKSVMVNLTPENINLSQRNAIGIRVKNPSNGYGISATTDNGEFIVEIIVKNKYDRNYKYTGHIGRYDASCALIELGGPVQPGVSVKLTTTGANSVSTVLVWATGSTIGGIGSSQTISINPTTNAVTVTPNGAAPPANWGPIPGSPNYYDPATGAIYISYKWSTPCAGADYGFVRHVRVKLTPK